MGYLRITWEVTLGLPRGLSRGLLMLWYIEELFRGFTYNLFIGLTKDYIARNLGTIKSLHKEVT